MIGIIATIVVLFGAFAFLLARSSAVSTVSERSLMLNAVDRAIADADAAHLLAGQSLLLAVDATAGLAQEEDVVRAIANARLRLASLEVIATELESTESGAVGRFVGTSAAFLDTLEAANLAGAKAVAQSQMSTAHETVIDVLSDRRASEVEGITMAADEAGVAATASAFVVSLAIPLVLLLGYRLLARRQLRRAEATARKDAEDDAYRAKDQFLAHVSHELRTPLTGISGFAHVLEEGSLFDPVTGLELVNLIINQAGELNRMVDDLLAASRLDTGSLSIDIEAVDVVAAINGVVPTFERFGASIPVQGPQLSALADPLRLKHLLTSLLANAITHGAPPLVVSVVPSGEMIEISVVDHGEGVPSELESVLFERFVHQGDRPLLVGSVGLGLAIARDLARRMGGNIRYERTASETRFVLELLAAPDVDKEQFDDHMALGGGQ